MLIKWFIEKIFRWIPDLKSGWEYRPLVRTMDHLDSNSWHSDDGSLRIEYLRGKKSNSGQFDIWKLFRCWESQWTLQRCKGHPEGRLNLYTDIIEYNILFCGFQKCYIFVALFMAFLNVTFVNFCRPKIGTKTG